MSEIEEQLRRHAEWLDSTRGDLDPTSVREAAVAGASSRSIVELDYRDSATKLSNPRRRLVAAAAAIVVAIATIGGVALISRRNGDVVTIVDQPTNATWTAVPDLTFTDADQGTDVKAIWTGTEAMLVGELVSPQAAVSSPPKDPTAKIQILAGIPAFNPSTRTWRIISPPPGELVSNGFAATWTGSRLVVFGGTRSMSGPVSHAVGASYDPSTDRWSPIAPAPPGRALGGPAVWAGTRVLTWALGVGVTAYDPATDSWAALTTEHLQQGATPPPVPGDPPLMNSVGASAAWTGTEFVVADGGTPTVAAFDPSSRTWRDLPARPTSSGTGPIVWTGRYLGVGDVRGPAWMEPTESQWHQSRGPASIVSKGVIPADVWFEGRFLAWGGGGSGPAGGPPGSNSASPEPLAVVVQMPGGSWSTVTAPPPGSPPFTAGLLAGGHVFTWGVDNDYRHTSGHGTIRAALGLSGPLATQTTGTTSPADAPIAAPPGVSASELAEGDHGFSATDETWQFGRFRRTDETQQVITRADAFAAARRGVPTFVNDGTEVTGELGHLLEVTGTGPPKDTLAWMLSFGGIPDPSQIEGPICTPPTQTCVPAPGTTIGQMTVVVDAHTGDVLLLQHVTAGGG